MRERFALFLPSLAGGGAERVMLHLARGFIERGIEVDLVLAQATGSYMSCIASQTHVVNLKAKRVLTSVWSLAGYLRSRRPTAMLSTQNHANVIALWAKRISGVSTRLIVREACILRPPPEIKVGMKQRLMPYLVHHSYQWANGIVAVSHGVAHDLVRGAGIAPNRINVIYNPVSTAEIRKRAREPVNHAWFEPGEPPVILGVGRLTPQKDFATLLRAFALVREYTPARLVILGEGECRSRLEALIRDLGVTEDVSLPGFVDNPYAYMSRAKVYVLSSRFEGLPNTVIEAMGVGTPVIATDCMSGPREILAHGKYGQLIPVGDMQALASAISNVIDARKCPEPQMSWFKAFSLDKCVSEYLELMRCKDKC